MVYKSGYDIVDVEPIVFRIAATLEPQVADGTPNAILKFYISRLDVSTCRLQSLEGSWLSFSPDSFTYKPADGNIAVLACAGDKNIEKVYCGKFALSDSISSAIQ